MQYNGGLLPDIILLTHVTIMGAPICNTVLQHFSCNMVDAIRTIPQEALF